jgi:hypothetical protein
VELLEELRKRGLVAGPRTVDEISVVDRHALSPDP